MHNTAVVQPSVILSSNDIAHKAQRAAENWTDSGADTEAAAEFDPDYPPITDFSTFRRVTRG